MNESTNDLMRLKDQRQSNVVKSQVLLLAATVSVMHGFAAVRKIYFGERVEEIVSFFANDIPTLPSSYQPQFVGVHTFGDYLLMRSILDEPSLATPSGFQTPWPPMTYLLFSPLKLLPYFVGLGLFLMISLAALLWPILSASRRGNWSALESLAAALSIAVFSGPSIMALDRGNTVALLPALLFWHLKALRQSHTLGAVTTLVLAVIIKPHALFFVLIPAVFKNWKAVWLATFVALTLHSLGFLISGGGLIPGIMGVVGATAAIANDNLAQMSISILSLLQLIGSNTALQFFAWRHVISILLVLWVVLLVYFLPSSQLITRLTLIFSSYPVLIPVSPAYNSVVLVGLFAVIIEISGGRQKDLVTTEEFKSRYFRELALSGVVIFVQLVPIPISFLGSGSIQRPIASSVFLVYLFVISAQRLFPSLEKIRVSDARVIVLVVLAAIAVAVSQPRETNVIQSKFQVSGTASSEVNNGLCSVNHLQSRHAVISLTRRSEFPNLSGVAITSGAGDGSLRISLTERWGYVRFVDESGSRWSEWIEFEENSSQNTIEVRIDNSGLRSLIVNSKQIPVGKVQPLIDCLGLRILGIGQIGTFPPHEGRVGIFETRDPLRLLRWSSIIGLIFGTYLLGLRLASGSPRSLRESGRRH